VRPFSRIALVGTTLVWCVGCDQISKGAVRHYLAPGESHSFVHDIFRLVHTENSGAFLSLGAALPEHARTVIFTGVVGLLSIAALLAALLVRRLEPWQIMALGLIAAGGCGNWIDRLTNGGRVTDFLNVGIGPLRTGIFNVADMALMIGVTLLLVVALPPAASDNRCRGP
jgi:signal peptidase II